jgi:tungstate transport system substrate-binding protein
MNRLGRAGLAVWVGLVVGPVIQAQSHDVVLATTTSVRDAGLLEALLPPFERDAGYTVKVVAVGSGQAMELGRRGEADILILHDPAGEARFMTDGFGIERRALMHNEFFLVGPADDPAGALGTDVVAAFRAIAAARAPFISRGDRSGTNVKERAIWRLAGVTPAEPWYRESGQGMGATLVVADQLRAYTLSDVATFLGHKLPLGLIPIVQGDTLLRNPYHVILENPERFEHVNAVGARALWSYVLSPEVQRQIGEFRKNELGRAIFVPDGTTVEDDRGR